MAALLDNAIDSSSGPRDDYRRPSGACFSPSLRAEQMFFYELRELKLLSSKVQSSGQLLLSFRDS